MTANVRTDSRGALRRAARWSVLLIAAVNGGCVSLPYVSNLSGDEPPPPGQAFQVVAWWQPEVRYAADPTRNGAAIPGLAGRIYLFGQEPCHPFPGDGGFVMDLFDASGSQEVQLEEWRFDPDTMKRLLRRDIMGWGYTVFLPWNTYKPEITRVHLKVRYLPLKGSPLFFEGNPMALNGAGATTPLVKHSQATPGYAPPPTTLPPPTPGYVPPPTPAGANLMQGMPTPVPAPAAANVAQVMPTPVSTATLSAVRQP
jgi:hypothetical protein